ncbi:uncharacterized protein LOC144004459 [Festucalex cinctus]
MTGSLPTVPWFTFMLVFRPPLSKFCVDEPSSSITYEDLLPIQQSCLAPEDMAATGYSSKTSVPLPSPPAARNAACGGARKRHSCDRRSRSVAQTWMADEVCK